MYSSISAGLQKAHSGPPPLLKQKSILENCGVVVSPEQNERIEQKSRLKKGKNPFKKRVTLGCIPSRLTETDTGPSTPASPGPGLVTGARKLSVSMVPPAVTIQGCTPPSEHDSLDGEICKYFKEAIIIRFFLFGSFCLFNQSGFNFFFFNY